MDVSWRQKYGYGAKQLIEVGEVCEAYGVKVIGDRVERSSGGRMNVRMVLSALEARMVVPSADLEVVR